MESADGESCKKGQNSFGSSFILWWARAAIVRAQNKSRNHAVRLIALRYNVWFKDFFYNMNSPNPNPVSSRSSYLKAAAYGLASGSSLEFLASNKVPFLVVGWGKVRDLWQQYM